MKEVVAALQANTDAWPFLQPVPRAEVPDYYDVIKVSSPCHPIQVYKRTEYRCNEDVERM
jgi:hypothetical protein